MLNPATLAGESLETTLGCATSTLPAMLRARAGISPGAVALWQAGPGKEWVSTSWNDYLQAVAALAEGFRKLGLERGDRVGIMAASSREWDFVQLGVAAAGGVAVGLDPHSLSQHIQAIAHSCRFAGIVLGTQSMSDKFGSETTGLRFSICLEAATGYTTLSELLATPVTTNDWDQSRPDDTATIIFTSGTTGAPKGIEYTHRQIRLAVAAILSAFPNIRESCRLVCWLPLSNLFQRMINLCAIERGAETFYVADPRKIMDFAPKIAPHLFIAVPRFYEKLYAGIQESIGRKPVAVRLLIAWALRVGDRTARARRARQPPAPLDRLCFALADCLVLRKLRGILGPNLQFMVSGSAPMPLWLLERFHAIGLLLLEAYGLSENVIPVALNRPDLFRLGTVGQPLPGCEVRLAEDGELLVRGPGVFKGYLGDEPEKSPRQADGFLPSGDFASIDTDGFISLVGRKSDIFKTSTGRRVAPNSIEGLLRQIPEVDQAVVFGARRPQPVALLSIAQSAWSADFHELAQRFRHAAATTVAPLPAYLHPAGLAITARQMTISGGELTANLKLRRRAIEASYADTLEDLYRQLDAAGGQPFETLSNDKHLIFCSL